MCHTDNILYLLIQKPPLIVCVLHLQFICLIYNLYNPTDLFSFLNNLCVHLCSIFPLLKINIFQPVHQHRIPENNFVTEKNMKNIITALPALHIDDSDSEKYPPEPVISRPNKVLTSNIIIYVCFGDGTVSFFAYVGKGCQKVSSGPGLTFNNLSQ